MSKNKFFMSDPHFSHAGIITFKRDDGTILRDFSTVEEMDELMVKNWNETVKPQDTVYMLGDIVMNRRALPILERLQGRKVLIKGNHDIFKLKDYLPHFDDIRAYKVMTKEGIICSHIPIHPDDLARWKINMHGHRHSGNVKYIGLASYKNDPRYLCVCVEQINYTPISLEEVLIKIGE